MSRRDCRDMSAADRAGYPERAPAAGQRVNGRRRRDGTGRWIRAQDTVPLPSGLLLIIIKENDPDKLVNALSLKPGWTLLLESDFQRDDLQAIFTALKKCCAAQSLHRLREFLGRTFVETQKFMTRCCVLLSSLDEEHDYQIVGDVISVLEASACLQPAGLAGPCMVLLRSLESHPMIRTWNSQSEMDFLGKIQEISEQITAVMKSGMVRSPHGAQALMNGSKLYKGYRTSGKAPDDFREMTIFPTQDDLNEKNPFLRSNIVKGAYESLDDYLDVQFRLLREDFVSPLRNGLREFRSRGSEVSRQTLRSIQDVRFYLGVVYQQQENSKPVYGTRDLITLILADEDYKRVRWEASKRFTNGSLVGISADHFETIIFATVQNRDPEKLTSSGTLTLELCFQADVFKLKTGIALSLIESSGAYFEAYRHTLAALQKTTVLPLSQYIVRAERTVARPPFASPPEKYNLTPILKEPVNRVTNFGIDLWPPVEETILNPRQFEAVLSAFKNELCIIQGPPGTGKTFIGLKIVELLLLNRVTTRPLLIVCYTNHALDQFLAGVSQFTQSIARIGGRCDSQELEKFTLRSLRHDRKRIHSEHERVLRHRILSVVRAKTKREAVVKRIEEFSARLEGRAIYEGRGCYRIDWSQKLDFDQLDMESASRVQEDGRSDFEEEGHWSDEDRGQLEDDFRRSPEIGKMKNGEAGCIQRREIALKNWLGSHRHYELLKGDSDFMSTLTLARHRVEKQRSVERNAALSVYGAAVARSSEVHAEPMDWWLVYRDEHWTRVAHDADHYLHQCMIDEPIDEDIFVEPYTMTILNDGEMDDVELSKKCLSFRLEQVRNNLRSIMDRLERLDDHLDCEIINSVEIIGITTTGAAKYHELIRKVDYEIVVAEEAAEVLEAHLVTCVSPSTKQLILIGDHQQLRPNTTVHNLATNFNLQVSLFERLINNGLPYVRLREQHRLRDEFLKLLVPTIYSDVFSHESVFEYEDIRGLSHNLFFITHEFPEEAERENSSRTNPFEAEFVTRLALYLRMQGYTAKQIAILTTYSGQVFAIKNFIHKLDEQYGWSGTRTEIYQRGARSRVPIWPGLPLSMFDGIRVTTVDNYQGEESDIVIASFVRSNEDQKIGFLSRDNRICVALSRAKKGFYCVGNLAMLAQASKTWRDISEVLLKGNYVNKGLELKCDVHDKRLLATSGSDFDLFSEGGCGEPCGVRLGCGHRCPKTCHTVDATHEAFQCLEECQRPRLSGHPCTRECYDSCGSCASSRTFPYGHDFEVENCHRMS